MRARRFCGIYYRNQYLVLMRVIVVVLLLGIALSSEICTLDDYNSYLSLYPLKCGDNCDEYKKYEMN